MPDQAAARAALQRLIDDYHNLSDADRAAMSEASVVRQFVDRLLEEVLGWPIKDPARYKYELHTQAGRPDLTLIPESGLPVFVEAKRFGVIAQLEQTKYSIRGVVTPDQLSLPGMAVDRTPEEQQAINYAFSNGGQWAILTNFEKLRLFNARRDWLVLSFENPAAYRDDFDLLWQLAYPNVLNGSLDALSNQRHAAEVDTAYLSFINEWREKLARDLVSRLDKNPWLLVNGQIDLLQLRAVVQRMIDRLVLMRFAEDHLVLPAGMIRSVHEMHVQSYLFDIDGMVDMMFRRFDEAHNSALFAYDLTDQASFSDEALAGLALRLTEARYRAMPADILGNTYEQYLGKRLALEAGQVVTRDNLETRKKQGSYYTPQVIVRHLTDTTLGRCLYGTRNGRPDGEPLPGETRQTSADIRSLRVLDAACGSGSFLIYAYQVLAEFYESEIARLDAAIQQRIRDLARQGAHELDLQIAVAPMRAERERILDFPRLILETHLYGVDLDPQAAEIAVVNLTMRAMERTGATGQKRLPLLLNQNIKVGNGLIGPLPTDPRLAGHRAELAQLIRLRVSLSDVHAQAGDYHAVERQLALESLKLHSDLTGEIDQHFAGLPSVQQTVRPFCWGVEFPEVFYDEAGDPLPDGGFTVILGNPPWEILKPDLREFYAQFDERIESKLTRPQTEARIAELDAADPSRRVAYEAHSRLMERISAYIRANPDYARQGRGDLATHKLFTERMWRVLAGGGRLGYVVPSGIYTDLGTKDLRQMLLFDEGSLDYLYSFSNERYFFNGVDHRFKFCLLAAHKGGSEAAFQAAFRFNPRVAVTPADFPAFIADPANRITVERESIRRFSPDSLSLMEFQNAGDYAVAEKIYGEWPLLGEQIDGVWNVKLTNEFHMTNDRHLFNTKGEGLPLYEGKMIHQYDAFYGEAQFWIAPEKLAGLPAEFQAQLTEYRIAHRRIARSTDARTLIAAIVPRNTACEVNASVLLVTESVTGLEKLYLCALLNSFVLDLVIRQKVSTTLNMFYLYSLPVPRLIAGNPFFDAIVPRAARLTCTRPEFAALWASVMPGQPLPAGEDSESRQRLRDEIDALIAHLYGLTRDEYAHILASFPLVFPDTGEGNARKAATLAAYDALA